MKICIYFDSKLKTVSGKHIPYWDCVYRDKEEFNHKDGDLVLFHEGYGCFREYELIKVDDENYITSPTGRYEFR